ncbi:TetR/AcrR family transcriptional regulator [Nonomuraea spiralis]|uniref:TetR/AcrR family transcriptional regulator n=1 Tax=Nonomuraea spiralis TaxID=46182 RepID=A0ABV5I6B9_9ACTN|nr:TetR family transcriptional regulator [Nonomuraea spiralis]GGS65712.1 hypothetical protein GCM10010176_005230 [Nonomuraea spiralis]
MTPDPTQEPAQERGRRRRATLLDAAVTLLTENGFTALTHRAVAQHAHLPLAATTYYFTSRDHLQAEAFAQLIHNELDTTRTWLTPHGITALPDHLATTDRARQLSLWELYTHAGRHPTLQHIARRWTDGCRHLIATAHHLTPDDPRTHLLHTTMTTLWLQHTVEQRPLDDLRTLLHTALKNTLNTPHPLPTLPP